MQLTGVGETTSTALVAMIGIAKYHVGFVHAVWRLRREFQFRLAPVLSGIGTARRGCKRA